MKICLKNFRLLKNFTVLKPNGPSYPLATVTIHWKTMVTLAASLFPDSLSQGLEWQDLGGATEICDLSWVGDE